MVASSIRVSKVCIIGAGVSGIAAAKQLSDHQPIVFEATNSIGGVWRHCSYNSTRLQSPRCSYEFTDYPWPERNSSAFPTHVEVVDYLHGYATHFNVLKYVEFNSKVVGIRFIGEWQHQKDFNRSILTGRPVWEVAVQTNQSETVKWYAFEYVVVCTGKYGDIPRMPTFPSHKGPEVFNGKVMHSVDYCKLNKDEAYQLLKGKRVVVVGYKKSAIDLALECAEANQGPDGKPCTMVVRTLHWTVPSYSIWGLPFSMFFSTRSSQFFRRRPNQGLSRDLICLLLSPMRKAISKFIESYLVWKLPLDKYGLKPEHPFEEDYASCQMAILPETFFKEADQGRILFEKTSRWNFWSGGVELEDKTKLEADLVLLATGFDGKKKLKTIMPEPYLSLLEDSSGIMPLYRGTIHPLIPNMAFVGYLESVSNLHSAELRSIWLARLLDNKFKLPSVPKMIDQINEELEVSRKTTRFYKRYCIAGYSINHSDEICEEMGWSSWRKKNWLLEAFSPYSSQDYEEQK